MKGTHGVFQVEEGSSSGYSRPGENQGWNSRRYEEGFHPHYQLQGGNQGWNCYRGEEPKKYWQDWAEQDDQKEDHTHLSESPKSKGSENSPRINDLLSRILNKVEGSDDLLKGMKDNFSSLNSKVNSHVDAIKMLEGKLSLLSAQLTSKTPMDYIERKLAVVTRSGKVAIGDMMEDEDSEKHEESQDVIDEAVASLSHLMRKSEPLESVLANYDESEVQGYEEVVAALSRLGAYSRNPIKLDIDLKNRESSPAKLSTEEPPNM
uniref:Integrase core domain containing protein n=1 Tax=Solanum tuberosum TaxID=4113 RepID=M1DT72_SOLTU